MRPYAMLRAMLANRLLRALHRPCCQTAYVYTRMYVHARTHRHEYARARARVCAQHECSQRYAHTHTRTVCTCTCTHRYPRASPFSAAVPISDGTASRCASERPTTGRTRAAWISNLSPSPFCSFSLLLFFSHSIARPPPALRARHPPPPPPGRLCA